MLVHCMSSHFPIVYCPQLLFYRLPFYSCKITRKILTSVNVPTLKFPRERPKSYLANKPLPAHGVSDDDASSAGSWKIVPKKKKKKNICSRSEASRANLKICGTIIQKRALFSDIPASQKRFIYILTLRWIITSLMSLMSTKHVGTKAKKKKVMDYDYEWRKHWRTQIGWIYFNLLKILFDRDVK